MTLLRHTLFLFLASFLAFFSNGQTLDWDWAEHGGGGSHGGANKTCSDAEGNVYTAGYFSGSITIGSQTITAQNSDYNSLFIAKYNAYQEVEWVYGGQNGMAFSIALGNDGSVYITGSHAGTTHFGSTTFTTNDGGSAFVLKLDADDGDQIWVKNIHTDPNGYVGYQYGRGIVVAPEGGIFVAGDFSGNTLMIDGVTVENPNVGCFGDIWFASFTSSGTLNWVKRMGGYGADEVAGLGMDSHGDIYMTGNSYGTTNRVFDTIQHAPSNERFFTAKFAPSGSIYWLRFAGNTYADAVNSIYTDPAGNSYITGTAWLTGSQDFGNGVSLPSLGYKDQFLVKYDTYGNTVWGKSIGGGQLDEGSGICEDKWGNICVAAYSQSPELYLENDTIPVVGAIMHISRFESNGNLAAVHFAAPTEYCAHVYPSDITSDSYGNLYVVGTFSSDSVQFGNVQMTKSGGCVGEYFIARLGNPYSTLSIDKETTTPLQVYPNPASDQLHLVLSSRSDIEVLSITGERVMQFSATSDELTLDISQLKSGIYLLRAVSGTDVFVTEFVKE